MSIPLGRHIATCRGSTAMSGGGQEGAHWGIKAKATNGKARSAACALKSSPVSEQMVCGVYSVV